MQTALPQSKPINYKWGLDFPTASESILSYLERPRMETGQRSHLTGPVVLLGYGSGVLRGPDRYQRKG